MLKIRLMRIGAKKRPFYRVVVVDERAKRNGAYLELVGTYNPLTEPHDIQLKKDRIDHWLKLGAVKSDGFLRIIGEAKQRPPRKPKKEKKTEESSAVSPQTSDKTEETAQVNPSEVSAAETTEENVIPNASEESPDSKSTDSSTAEPDQNDKVEEEPTK